MLCIVHKYYIMYKIFQLSQYYLDSFDCMSKLVFFADRIILRQAINCLKIIILVILFTHIFKALGHIILSCYCKYKKKPQQTFNMMKLLDVFKLGNKTFFVCHCMPSEPERGNLTLTFKT